MCSASDTTGAIIVATLGGLAILILVIFMIIDIRKGDRRIEQYFESKRNLNRYLINGMSRHGMK